MSEARILVVDDRKDREGLATLLKDVYSFSVCVPSSPDALRRCLLLESFDGALVDIRLRDWGIDEGKILRVGGATIKDGIDVVKYCREMHSEAALALHSAFLPQFTQKVKNLPFSVMKIPKPTPPDEDKLREDFDPFYKATLDASKSSSAYNIEYKKFQKSLLKEQLHAYRMARHSNANWLKTIFKTLGDVAWVLICDRRVELVGKPLDHEGKELSRVGIKWTRYPTEEDIISMARKKHYFPYIFWNTRDMRFLEKQFALAGSHLENIPSSQRDFFSVAMAPLFADTYVDSRNNKLLKLCDPLNIEGKLEITREIFKRIKDGKQSLIRRFAEHCKQSRLPVIVEIFKGSLDSIEEDTTTGWVELIQHGKYRPALMEPFDLDMLRENGVKYKDQEFDYTVYKLPNSDMGINIELIEAHEENPFSFS